MKNLVAFLDQRGQSDETDYRASYQTVRFTGLSEIKSTYGQDSTEFQRAKQVLKAVLQAAVDKFDSLTATRPQKLALITLAQQENTLQPRSLDLHADYEDTRRGYSGQLKGFKGPKGERLYWKMLYKGGGFDKGHAGLQWPRQGNSEQQGRKEVLPLPM